jgi:hypothetical protein
MGLRHCLWLGTSSLLLGANPLWSQQVTIIGRIVDSVSSPIELAEVIQMNVTRQRAALTARDGRFHLTVPEPGPYRLLIRRIGYLAVEREVIAQAPSQPLEDVQLTAVPLVLGDLMVEGRIPTPSFRPHFDSTAYRFIGRNVGLEIPLFAGAVTQMGWGFAIATEPRGRYMAGVKADFSVSGHGQRGVGGACLSDRYPLTIGLTASSDGEAQVTELLHRDGTVYALPWRGHPTRDCELNRQLIASSDILSGALTEKGWLVATSQTDHVLLEFFPLLSDRGHPIPLPAGLTFLPSDSVMMAAVPNGASIAASISPFSWGVVDEGGHLVTVGEPLTESTDPKLSELEGWRGYPVIPIVDGFVRTIQRPDRRKGVLLIYDLAGRLVETRSGRFPIPIAATSEGRRLALVVRYRGELAEMAIYQY